MAIDPNIALQIGQGVPQLNNPLDTMGKFQNIANAMAQNKLIGANTAQTEQGTAAARLKAMGGIAATALNSYDPANPGSIRSVAEALKFGIGSAVQNGTLDQNTANQLFNGIASTRGPEDLLGKVRQFALIGLDPNTALSRIYGTNTSVQTGQGTQPGVAVDPFNAGGFKPVGQEIKEYPSLTNLNEPVIIGYDANNNPVYGPKVRITPPNLGGPPAGGPPAIGGGGGAPSPLGNGRVPGALMNPNKPQPPPVTGEVTRPGAAAIAAQTATGSESAKAFQAIADAGVQAQSQEAILANMQSEAQQFAQGPGQDRIKAFQAAALRFAAPLAAAFGIDEKAVAANTSFDKLAAQIQDAQGAGSDARLRVVQAANPSSSLNPAGIDLILKQLRGNTDYLRVRAKLAADWPDKADRAKFESEVAANLDPRAFQFQRLDATQQNAFLKSIKDESDKKKFKEAYFWARDKGLFGAAP